MTLADIPLTTLDGRPTTLAAYADRVVLVVNVASKCGLTPQYEGLEKLYKEKHAAGLEVLGFPANDFKQQEPGSEAEIKQFCSLNYDVTFPLFAKIEVNGANAHPLYRFLKQQAKGLLGSEAIKWNFTKFLVDGKGAVLRRYAPTDTPAGIGKDLEAML